MNTRQFAATVLFVLLALTTMPGSFGNGIESKMTMTKKRISRTRTSVTKNQVGHYCDAGEEATQPCTCLGKGEVCVAGSTCKEDGSCDDPNEIDIFADKDKNAEVVSGPSRLRFKRASLNVQ